MTQGIARPICKRAGVRRVYLSGWLRCMPVSYTGVNGSKVSFVLLEVVRVDGE